MRYVLLFLLFICCGETSEKEEKLPERNIIVYVCHNPGSIWHLSECNEQCTRIDYNNNAYCLGLTDVMCEQGPSRTDFVRRACGLYYR
tara:strand:- start:260 stop:523 length:264 start_codon:yes stop_codon:yes gene_type:complete